MSSWTGSRLRRLRRDLGEGRCESLDRLFDELFPLLFHYALTLVRQVPVAHELAAEAMGQVVGEPERLKAIKDLRLHLYQSVRQRAGQTAIQVGPQAAPIFELPGEGPQLEDRLLLLAALDQLPRQQLELVLLHLQHGWELPQVAAIVACPVGKIREQYRLTVSRLREMMGGAGWTNGPSSN